MMVLRNDEFLGDKAGDLDLEFHPAGREIVGIVGERTRKLSEFGVDRQHAKAIGAEGHFARRRTELDAPLHGLGGIGQTDNQQQGKGERGTHPRHMGTPGDPARWRITFTFIILR